MPPPLRIAAWLFALLTPIALLNAFQLLGLPSQQQRQQRIGRYHRRSGGSSDCQPRGRGKCIGGAVNPRIPRTCCEQGVRFSSIASDKTHRRRGTESLPASTPFPNIEAPQKRRLLLLALATQLIATIPPRAALAAVSSSPLPPASLQIQESIDALQSLVDNWSTAVVDCTYADVPRELLETKNKAELLEKAKTSALFDKSASVVSCKTSNRIVRDYLGSTGKGPLVALDKALRKGLDQVNGDAVDEYLQLVEQVQSDLSKADSLSYTAGVTDLSSINNFDKGGEDAVLSSNSSLQEAKGAIQAALSGLNRIVLLLS